VRVLDATAEPHRNSHYCLSIVLDGPLASRRDELVADLRGSGVGTSLYYPQPVPRMQYYREKYSLDESAFPNAAAISDRSIALPVGPHIDEGDAQFIGETVADAVSRFSR
jgi:perosamine synthetase